MGRTEDSVSGRSQQETQTGIIAETNGANNRSEKEIGGLTNEYRNGRQQD